MKKNKIVIVGVLTTLAMSYINACFAQDIDSSKLEISGYVETYYSYDFNKPLDHIRQPFMYSYNRHNEVALNLGYIKASYSSENVRANFALMAGTYANDNLAAESKTLQHIYEANAGVKLSTKRDIWIDAGVLPSHIGFESARGMDCWNLTRSLLAENSPYYETGARLSYNTPNGKWYLAALVLNGWQRIDRVNGNNTPTFGHQITFKPSDKLVFNSSSFIGNDFPDSTRRMRYFHNFYMQWTISNHWGLIGGFDIGAQQKEKGSSAYDSWYSPVVIVKYTADNHWSIAGRAEKYRDKNGVIIAQAVSNGTNMYGYSMNVDYQINKHAIWRIEGRQLHSPQNAFVKGDQMVKNDFFLTTSLAVSF